ncbi:diacylglycerol kinase family lipid kinase [bacterium]|nr:diacylglycerol kinase family lipid kinase [bacterium]
MNLAPIKTRVIVNPDSNPRYLKKHLRHSLKVLKDNGFELSVIFTKGPGEVLPLAQSAAKHGYECVIAVGGDGTANECINGIIGQNVTLGLLPIGGSNVLARELKYPMDLVEAARVISRRNKRCIDLGRINGRYFSMMASCGYDAYAISRTDLRIKKIIRRWAYLIAGLKDFAGYKPTTVYLSLDNGRVVEQGTFVALSNTHFYGGTHQMSPFAEIDDGMLDLVIYQGKSQMGLVHFVFRMIWRQHINMRRVKYYRVKHVKMWSDTTTLVQVDGDPLGELPMEAEVCPGVLDVFC